MQNLGKTFRQDDKNAKFKSLKELVTTTIIRHKHPLQDNYSCSRGKTGGS